MKLSKLLAMTALLALLLVPAAMLAQEQKAPERGVVEFGFRGVTGEVYGRTQAGTLPYSNGFRPELFDSPLNLYSDYRNQFYIPKLDTRVENLFGSQQYLRLQSSSNGFAFSDGASPSRDQSVLLTFGQYGRYKAQFRFDQTPHLFSGTTRTLFSSGGQGVWNVDPTMRNTLYTALKSGPTASVIANAVSTAAAGVVPFTQEESRKTFGGSFGAKITPDLNLTGLFTRENQVGTRPIGFVMGSGSTGYMVEAPETMNYHTDNLKIGAEFGFGKDIDGLLGYQGSFFKNNIPSMTVMNPFSTTFTTAGGVGTVGPAFGRMDLYPDNRYQQFVAQGAANITKYVHVMASITPGALRQDQQFQPLTTNTFISQTPPNGYPAYLPSSNLNGQVDTLAMNYTAVLKATKDLKIVAKYQHYRYDDKTAEMLVRPIIADTSFLTSFHGSAGAWFDPVNTDTCAALVASNGSLTNCRFYLPAEGSSFTTKLFDIGGTYFLNKKSLVKFGYQRGWVDRTNREVAETTEDTVYGALDLQLRKHLMLRISGRHQNRVPQEYELDTGNVYSRMPDQSTRKRNRGDASLTWDATQRLSIYGFWGTLQDNFNQAGGVNSVSPLGDASLSPLFAGMTATATPIYGPYYAYGLLNTIGRNYGAGFNYALTPNIVLFAEYAREKNTGVIVEGRNGNVANCYTTTCDPINDLLTANKDVVNSYYGGVDITTNKKLDFSLYYSLSAGQSFSFSDGVNCQTSATAQGYCDTRFSNWNLDQAAFPAVNLGYPQNVNRIHEVGAIVRFKLTQNVIPKFQYIYRQNDSLDWQTQVNPYSFVGTTPNVLGYADPTGATAIQKMLWLGADQPSYRAHIFSATLEYHF
ncbi:MAG: MtrB/PioB family outer membrane beta-barrel protein [Terriglobales bacterium]